MTSEELGKLNARIARDVMGLEVELIDGSYWQRHNRDTHSSLEPYSSDIRAAWKVVEKAIELGYAVDIRGVPSGDGKTLFVCKVTVWQNTVDPIVYSSISHDAAIAICEAVLDAAPPKGMEGE